MTSHSQLTRRAFWRICGTGCLLQTMRGAERLRWEAQPAPGTASSRTYRADAQILFLSMPMLRRSGVGAGRVTWSENAKCRLLDFTGYSFPERAAGLNRLGFIRELARKDAEAVEYLYFGLMTASREESAAEAREALHNVTSDHLFTAIEGRVAAGSVETATCHFTAPARVTVAQYEDLLAMARHALAAASHQPPEFELHTNAEPTFLQALAELLQEPSRSRTRYVYNARRYDLSLRRSADSKATAYFRAKGLIGQDATVVRAEGRLQREAGGKETTFQVWVEEGARPLPLRIEFQPKSYLRLTFEADVTA